MAQTPLRAVLVSTLLLASSLLIHCGRTSFEDRLLRLLRAQREDELLALMKQQPDRVRQILSDRMETWIKLAQKGNSDQAAVAWQETRALANIFGKLRGEGYEHLLESHLLRCLRGHRIPDLNCLIRQDPSKFRQIVQDRLVTRTNLEKEGRKDPADTMLRETLDLARALETLTAEGFYGLIQLRASMPLAARSTLQPKVAGLYAEAGTLYEKRQYEPVIQKLAQAEATNRDLNDPYWRYYITYLRGRALLNQRHYTRAHQELVAARQLCLSLGFNQGLATVDPELGSINVELGRLSEALRLFRPAIAEQHRMLLPIVEANTRIRLGALYFRMGDLPRSMEAYQEALRIQDQALDSWNRPGTLNNLGLVYLKQAQYPEAESFLRQALEAAKAVGRREMRDLALNNLGELYSRVGEYKKAIEYLQMALKAKTEIATNPPYSIAWTLHALGETYLSMRNWTDAEDYLAKALREAQRSETGVHNAILRAIIYDLQGRLARDQGRYDPAAAAFEQAVLEIEGQLTNLEAQDWKTSLLSSSQDLYQDMILFQREQRANPAAAFEFAEKARARAFLDLMISEGVQLEYDDPSANGGNRLYNVHASAHAQPLKLSAIQRALPPGLAVVEYTVTGNQLLIWVLDAAGLQSRSVDIPRTELVQSVKAFREAVTLDGSDFKRQFRNGKAALQETHRRGIQLYRYLIAPIADLLPRHRMICFIPDDILYYVPFAALTNPAEPEKYLIEDYLIFYAPSASILAVSLKLQKQRGRPLLVVSNPEIGKRVEAEFPYLHPLEAAERFDHEITHIFAGAQALMGAEASKSAVLAAMPDYEIIHFSTHGILNDKEPLFSSLVLGPDASRHGTGPSDHDRMAVLAADGLLYTYELFPRKLPKTRLITLAACETALGALWRGEGMVGMARAVFYAKVPSLIVTQWKIDDRASGQLLAEFYKQLSVQPNIAEALARAQRAHLRAAVNSLHRHPYYWGGFCLIGSFSLKTTHSSIAEP